MDVLDRVCCRQHEEGRVTQFPMDLTLFMFNSESRSSFLCAVPSVKKLYMNSVLKPLDPSIGLIL